MFSKSLWGRLRKRGENGLGWFKGGGGEKGEIDILDHGGCCESFFNFWLLFAGYISKHQRAPRMRHFEGVLL